MPTDQEHDLARLRAEMVAEIAMYARLVGSTTGRERLDDRTMAAIGRVLRHEFVPATLRPAAYLNIPLPIGFGKTISQPFIVALMTDLLDLDESDRVLEVGTGLGYQAAVLAELAARVATVELVGELAADARRRLDALGYERVASRVGDGAQGWAEHAPYDKIIVTAAPETIPPRLLDQLKPGGRMILPLGPEDEQRLCVVTKDAAGRTETKPLIEVRFSPLIVSH